MPSSSLIIRVAAQDSTTSESASDVGRRVNSTLYIPKEDPDVTLWSVAPPSLEAARSAYDFEDIKHVPVQDEGWLRELTGSAATTTGSTPTLHIFDSAEYAYPTLPALFFAASFMKRFAISTAHLQRALHRARLIKTPLEIAYIREACRISSGAHEVVMRELGRFARRRARADKAEWADRAPLRTGKEAVSEWEIESEADAEAVFVACCKRSGYVGGRIEPRLQDG